MKYMHGLFITEIIIPSIANVYKITPDSVFILHYSVNRICYLDPTLKKVPQKFWIVKGFSFLNGFFCEPSPIRKHPAVGFLQKNKCKKALGVFWEFVMVPGCSMLHFWTIP